MAELLPVGTTAASSADFTIASGAKALITLKAAASGSVPPDARVLVERKDAAGVYTVMKLMDASVAGLTFENTGGDLLTMRATRIEGGAVGVDQV